MGQRSQDESLRWGDGIAIWISIREGWEDMYKSIEFKVGNSKRGKFWTEIWCALRRLAEHSENLCRISNRKDAFINKYVQFTTGVNKVESGFSWRI